MKKHQPREEKQLKRKVQKLIFIKLSSINFEEIQNKLH